MSVIRVDATGPFNHRAALALLAAHAVPGAERVDRLASTYERIVRVEGRDVAVQLQLDAGGITATFGDDSVQPERAHRLITDWFDLETDIVEVDRALAFDPHLAPLVARRPGLRLVGVVDEFEAVATTVIGQQVSLTAARVFVGRLVAYLGDRIGNLWAFPPAERIAGADPEELRGQVGLTRARTRTLQEVAVRWTPGAYLEGLTAQDARHALLEIPGVGPWTADYVLVRALRHPDTFLPGDLVARRALGLDKKAAAARSRSWAPFRSYALLHLWTESSYEAAS